MQNKAKQASKGLQKAKLVQICANICRFEGIFTKTTKIMQFLEFCCASLQICAFDGKHHSGPVRDPFGTRSGPVRDAFGTRSGPFGSRSGCVRDPFGRCFSGVLELCWRTACKTWGLMHFGGKNGVLRIFRTPAMLLSGNAKPMLPFLVCEGAILGLFCVFFFAIME